jgi:putative endonuclease
MPTWWVYILECKNESFYVGSSKDPQQRFQDHCQKKGALFTRGQAPVRLAWMESHSDVQSARKRETQLKGWSRRKKIALIQGNLADLKIL